MSVRGNFGLEADIREAAASRLQVRETMHHLQDVAGVEELAALKAAIERSDRFRGLKEALARTNETLAAQGDGLSIADLESECRDVDLDQLVAREEAVERELQELRERLMQARETRTQARQEFERVGGDDAAAVAEADRQAALAEMSDTAAQYCQVRASSLLLQWAVDRYRQQMQAPLLTRAGRLFAGLTNSSFAGLELEYDEQDAPRLAGAHADVTRVGVDGMSTGTLDQLYLALRIASVEEYLGRAPQLPFIADDLFINFDDLRAQAGLAILAQLATRTQVIFLTHHQHLVELAEATVPGVSVLRLTQGVQERPAGGEQGARAAAR